MGSALVKKYIEEWTGMLGFILMPIIVYIEKIVFLEKKMQV
jgi:hypothetical protein